MPDHSNRTPAQPKRRGLVNADVPSETIMQGLPDVGEGASAAQFTRDAVSLNADEGQEDSDGAKHAGQGDG